MIINIDKILTEHNIKRKGIIHIGGYKAEEYEDYNLANLTRQIWVEANPRYYEEIVAKLTGNPDCLVFNELIYDVEANFNFGISNNGASSSMLPLKNHKIYYPNISYDGYMTIKAKKLKTLIIENNINITEYNGLVVDVQGVELNVFKSLEELINNFDYIQTEVNVEELYEGCCLIENIDAYLEKHNFKRIVTKMWDDGAVGWGDAFYIKIN